MTDFDANSTHEDAHLSAVREVTDFDANSTHEDAHLSAVREVTGTPADQPKAPPLSVNNITIQVGAGGGEGFKADAGKDPWELLSWPAILGIVKVLKYGLNKYAFKGSGRKPDNWRYVENGVERYFAAAVRHIVAWRLGEKNDPESGLPHLWHALCNLMFLVELDGEVK